jgi:hypothetical protein
MRAIQFDGCFTMGKRFFVYIVTNKPWGTLYIGVTSDLEGRIFQHKNGALEGFTKRYGLGLLVYAEGMMLMRLPRFSTKSGSRNGRERGR